MYFVSRSSLSLSVSLSPWLFETSASLWRHEDLRPLTVSSKPKVRIDCLFKETVSLIFSCVPNEDPGPRIQNTSNGMHSQGQSPQRPNCQSQFPPNSHSSSSSSSSSRFRQLPEGSAAVRVYCRVKPIAPDSSSSSTEETAIHVIDTRHVSVRLQDPLRTDSSSSSSRVVFGVEKVFGPLSSQQEIFESVALPLLLRCCSGREACVVVYGQSSSGKTHTLLGPHQEQQQQQQQQEGETAGSSNDSLSVAADAGLLSRVGAALLQQQQQQDGGLVIESVSLSLFEIYKEMLTDLITGEGPLRLRQLQQQQQQQQQQEQVVRVQVMGLTEVRISGVRTLQKIVAEALKKRRCSSTQLNSRSSRSHLFASFSLHLRDTTTGTYNIHHHPAAATCCCCC